jgi:hypothetical protein
VSSIVVLMGLLFLSYLGSVITASTGQRSGLPGGSGFLIVGVLAGPLVFGAVTRTALSSFDPIVYVAVAWLALVSGLEYGWVRGRRVTLARVFEGILLGVLCGAIVGLGVWYALPFIARFSFADRLLLSGGIGCVCAETTRHAVRWVSERYDTHGPLTDLLADLSNSDELVPIGVVAVIFAFRTPARATVHLPPIGWGGATIVVGIVLGLVTALLLARDLRVAESWGTILGTSLFATGVAARLDLAVMATMFACGATIAWFSRHRGDIRAMIVPTERSVLLPVLVLAGARIEPASIGRVALIIPVAVVLRFVGKLVVGQLIRGHAAARGAGALLGVALTSSGGMSVAIGLTIAIRFPGPVGDTVLATAVAVTMTGEISGPALRTVLLRAGEAHERSPEAPPVSSDRTAPTDQPEGSS